MSSARIWRFGGPLANWATSMAFTNNALDGATKQQAFTFRAREDTTITRLGFRYGVRTGTPPTYRISLQSPVVTTGDPDGVILGGGSPASATFTPPASTAWDGTWQWVTLSNSIAVTRGTYYAIVIDYSAGTIDASNNGSFTLNHSGEFSSDQLFPYSEVFDGAVWAKNTTPPVFGYGSAGQAYGFPFQSAATVAVNTGTTPDEYGIGWALPADWGNTYTVLGARVQLTLAAAKTILMQLYDGATVLQNATIDTDIVAVNAGNRTGYYWFDESALSILSYGKTYRLSFTPSDATSQSFREVGFAAAGDVEAIQGGQLVYKTSRADAGAWTDSAVARPLIELQIADTNGVSAFPVYRKRMYRQDLRIDRRQIVISPAPVLNITSLIVPQYRKVR